jgi:hypothetical protein
MATLDPKDRTEHDEVFEVVKHKYIYFSLHIAWINMRPTISVNKFLQISFDGSPWHGSAIYTVTEGVGQWAMTFNYKGDMTKMKTVLFKEMPHTTSFLHLNDTNNDYNAMLIPYDDEVNKGD